MLNKIACSYHNTAAISENGDLYIWGSGSSGILGVENTTVQVGFFFLFGQIVIIYKETPKKISLDSTNPNLRVIQVSMGPNHLALVATHNLMKHINTQMYIEPIHKVHYSFSYPYKIILILSTMKLTFTLGNSKETKEMLRS